ncbi:MAG: right-handed parallel beta-helix repeat-containing protein [Candidatus Bathyarchaeota archaeon]|jgi:parallel beta-helix repeat protein
MALLVSALILVFAVDFGLAQVSTEVTGILASDIMWTKSNSPYYLTGPVLVSNGVTLTIEAGTTVNLNDHYIRVEGTLRAIGTSAAPICFNHGSIGIDSDSVSWNEQTGSGCVIENSVLDDCPVSIGNVSPKLVGNTIDGGITIQSYSTGAPIITDNKIVGGISIPAGSPVVVNNTISSPYSEGSPSIGISIGPASPTVSHNNISGCYFGITVGYTNSTIANNIISDCQFGLFISANPSNPLTVERNYISGNTQSGIRIETGSILIQNNTITDNTVGISFNFHDILAVGSSSRILHNNIYSNTEYNIDLGFSTDIDATNNWWGTTGTSAINQSIKDFKNDFNLGTVNFVPFLAEPVPEEMSTPIPEFPSWLILPLFLMGTVAVTVYKKKLTRGTKIH